MTSKLDKRRFLDFFHDHELPVLEFGCHGSSNNHTIIAPVLRGTGLSSQLKAGYDKKTEAADVAMVMDRLNVYKADLVTHDIGNMVGYALAPLLADRISKCLSIAAPLRGIGWSGAA